ncbi:MAG: hypothetical protein IPG04_39290 [Polyangiaceae bacterium]|nr:hypothetical protein [Polyangiaceae bacterium]
MRLIPSLGGVHRDLLGRRLGTVRHLIEDAQHLHGIDLAIVVVPTGERVSVSVTFGMAAVLLVAELQPMAAALTALRPWIPIVVTVGDSRRLAFGCVRSSS